MAEATFSCMKAAYDCGVNMFDCAEAYSGGESEKVMGAAIKKYGWKRNDLVISTKVRPPQRRRHARTQLAPFPSLPSAIASFKNGATKHS